MGKLVGRLRIESQELVAAKHTRLACHLQARPLLRSIGYISVSNLKLPPPACPGTTCN